MSGSSRKFVAGLLLLLAAGTLIGWYYGYPARGLLAAALLALAWQVRNLLAFHRALRTQNFDAFRYGEGIWEQLFSRFSYEHERAERYKSQYRRLVKEIRKSTNAMPDGAVILDMDNQIVTCNRAAKALAGLKRKKDRGQRVDNILRDPALTKLLVSKDYTSSVEIRSPIKDDAWLNCRVVPYGANQKLLFLRDVTERMRLTRMRRDFVANASHELRSPLTVISGYLDSLADDREIPEGWVQPITQMQSQARRMTRIVSELLELSRLESAGPASMDETVNVAGLLAAAKKTHSLPGTGPVIEVRAESTAQVRGHATEIESLINNLVSNAVRHTPIDGTITLTWSSDADGGRLSVRDTGEGIPEEHLPRLTERFFRVDRGRAREDGGVGLGLAIVKHVVVRHDAELLIVSEPGAGSEFVCLLPPERVVTEAPIPLAGDAARA
ncbi:MAG: phosphate regulon sensor histidine kinase PhoR [Woeseiaceae bacterium]|nr:phosphate regulon sensor histidine kinase PhoR [Woeseiaceae bacterium]